MSKKTLNVIHLSHTDIGYTDTQARIIKNQVNYLHNLVADYKKTPERFENWVWTTESFFIVEQFLLKATEEEKQLFDELVNKKHVALSASYLNLSELVSGDVYGQTLKRIKGIATGRNWPMNTAVTDDVNGFSYGWASALANNGIKNLYFGLHTHHGMYPTFRKQSPFWWETKDGSKVLVWVGEHYQLGTEFGIVDSPMGNYILRSNHENGYFDEEKQISEGKKRMKEYIENMVDDGYIYDNIPVSVLGAATDNAPYNLDIKQRIEKLNVEWADLDVEIKMVTPDEFFENIRNEGKEIPTYSGDWPDWWTDGTGSKPQVVRVFRQAQRNYELIMKLGIESDLIPEIEKNLMLFSEHTFGTWDSMEVPSIFENVEIDLVKASFAGKAQELTTEVLDIHTNRQVFKLFDEEEVKIKIINPFKTNRKTLIRVEDYFGWKESTRFSKGVEVYNGDEKLEVVVQTSYYMKIPTINHYVLVDLSSSSEIVLTVRPKEEKRRTMTGPLATEAVDGQADWYNPNNSDKVVIHNKTFENDFVIIKWDDNSIFSVVSKATNEELINPNQEGLFTPIHEVGDMPYNNEAMNLHRRWTGRNRKAWNTVRTAGTLKHAKVLNDDIERTVIEFVFDAASMKTYSVTLTIANETKQIDARVRFIKEVEWSAENVYISIPFNREESTIYFDKGEMFEVGKEQIPGSLIDYYAVQHGMEINTNKESVLISTLDGHLMWTGPLEYQKRFLAGDSRNTDKLNLYAWTMNNVWETNFQASLGGFHEFNYSIYLPGNIVPQGDVIQELKTMNKTYIVNREK